MSFVRILCSDLYYRKAKVIAVSLHMARSLHKSLRVLTRSLRFSPFKTSVCAYVRQNCFSDAASRRPADLMSSYATIRTVLHQLYNGLHEILLRLLRSSETREYVLNYLAEVVTKNGARSQMQVKSSHPNA